MGTRIWENGVPDHGSIHSMGNGRMVAYGQGPDLVKLYGPPCSSPGFLEIKTEFDGTLCDAASREAGSAIWNHESRPIFGSSTPYPAGCALSSNRNRAEGSLHVGPRPEPGY